MSKKWALEEADRDSWNTFPLEIQAMSERPARISRAAHELLLLQHSRFMLQTRDAFLSGNCTLLGISKLSPLKSRMRDILACLNLSGNQQALLNADLQEPRQKIIDVDTAVQMLQLTMPHDAHLPGFTQFLQDQTEYKSINQDQWTSFWRFAQEVILHVFSPALACHCIHRGSCNGMPAVAAERTWGTSIPGDSGFQHCIPTDLLSLICTQPIGSDCICLWSGSRLWRKLSSPSPVSYPSLPFPPVFD